jgi:murein DD-endopeptidase MepM/ murein hydrolase activator NlpD
MKKLLSVISVGLLLTACELEASQQEQNDPGDSSNQNEVENLEDKENQFEELALYSFDTHEQYFVSVEELTNDLGGSYEYNEIDKSLTMSVADREFYLVYGVPVLEIDGIYIDSDRVLLMEDEEGEVYLTDSFIKKGLETDYEYDEEESMLSLSWTDQVVQAWASSEPVDLHSFSTDEMVDYLSFLEKPIKGASVSTAESHLPGAPRTYRNGTHEGIDWYDYSSGTEITTETPIYAMATGIVVRVDDDFNDYPSHEVRDHDLQIADRVGFTPEYIIDRLRGQQVWVQYDDGVMNRFAHLDSIPENLKVGQEVTKDTIIGFVGNSGTSGALNQDGSGLHLHQDLLIYGELFWEPFTLDEAAQILRELWQ